MNILTKLDTDKRNKISVGPPASETVLLLFTETFQLTLFNDPCLPVDLPFACRPENSLCLLPDLKTLSEPCLCLPLMDL